MNHNLPIPRVYSDVLHTPQWVCDLDLRDALFALELKHRPPSHYMDTVQGGELNDKMRQLLVEWMQDVGEEEQFENGETLQLAVLLVDRFCARRKIRRSEYQCLGAACLWIAAKLCEMHRAVPRSELLVHLSDHAFNKHQLKSMEKLVLNELGWEVNSVTPVLMLEIFLSFLSYPLEFVDRIRVLARTFLTASQHVMLFLEYLPSTLAAASLMLALCYARVDCPQFELKLAQEFERVASVTFSNSRRYMELAQLCTWTLHTYVQQRVYPVMQPLSPIWCSNESGDEDGGMITPTSLPSPISQQFSSSTTLGSQGDSSSSSSTVNAEARDASWPTPTKAVVGMVVQGETPGGVGVGCGANGELYYFGEMPLSSASSVSPPLRPVMFSPPQLQANTSSTATALYSKAKGTRRKPPPKAKPIRFSPYSPSLVSISLSSPAM
ncbi:uncharacterized protein VTP21DRAFT_835 [Calcarisporiella thermophila]|uniref:uncharacterized protein n=1 Tax=Calcarisporiella thermophila TaxID=911321 RepID=UPI003743CCB1